MQPAEVIQFSMQTTSLLPFLSEASGKHPYQQFNCTEDADLGESAIVTNVCAV